MILGSIPVDGTAYNPSPVNINIYALIVITDQERLILTGLALIKYY